MNRTILIIIVDFLLLSLVTFAKFDNEEPAPKTSSQAMAAGRRDQDMVDALKVTLDQERQQRDQINQQLNQTQDTLRTREQLLSDRDLRMRQAQENLQRKADEVQRLASDRALVESQLAASRTNLATLQSQLAQTGQEARSNKLRLSTIEADFLRRQSELDQAKSEAQLSKDLLARMEAGLRKRQQEFEAARHEATVTKGVLDALQEDLKQQNQQSSLLQQNLSQAEQVRAAAEAEKQILAGRLQVVEAEKNLAKEQASADRTEKARLIDSTAKLSQGVQALSKETAKLAANSDQLVAKSDQLSAKTEQLSAKTDEMSSKLAQKSDTLAAKSDTIAQKTDALGATLKDMRALAPNTLFSDFLSNRVISVVNATRSGIFGRRVDKEQTSSSVLIQDGTNIYALLHVDDTPLSFNLPMEWEHLALSVRHDAMTVSPAELFFWAGDPRVVLIPLDPARAADLKAKIYTIAADPSKYQEAILVGAKESYYGECPFQLQADNPNYLRMDRNLLKRISGINASPSRGDLVFSKGGQIIGIMVNKEFCALVKAVKPLYSLRAGVLSDQQKQLTFKMLAGMRELLLQLPLRLQ